MKVKVCGMKNRENIREIITCKPDFLGFIFYPTSKRYVGESFDPRFLRSIPPYINKVGVFVNEDPEALLQLVARYGLDYVQLHGDEEPSYAATLKAKKIGVIKSFGLDENIDFRFTEPYMPHCDYFLFDTKSEAWGGSGEKFSWQLLQKFSAVKPFFLSGGINPEDADSIAALQHPSLFGIDINSGFEISPGLKDVFKVSEFIKTIKKV
jgi:phosphoribosylanthranilate isomerase